jgi:hypothetical protein
MGTDILAFLGGLLNVASQVKGGAKKINETKPKRIKSLQKKRRFELNDHESAEVFWEYIASQHPKYIFISGGILNNTFGHLQRKFNEIKIIEELINSGCRFEFVILNPLQKEATRLFINNVYGEENYAKELEALHETIVKLCEFRVKYGEENIKISLSNHVPAFKIIAMYDNVNTKNKTDILEGFSPKIIRAVLYSEQVEGIELLCYNFFDCDKDKTAYDHFYDQIKKIRKRVSKEDCTKDLEEIVKKREASQFNK